MSAPGRPKSEYRSAQHEGTPVSAAQAGHHAELAHGAHDPGHSEPHGHDHGDGGYHFSVKGYVIGFLLSVVLTAIPFWLVMGKVLPTQGLTVAVILGFAAVQIVVHMVYFLHMNAKIEGGWSMLALIFTAALVLIMLAGSIWVMFHLNANMMPVHDMRTMP